MDVEKLINLVSERIPLWDKRDKNYHLRNVQRVLWNEVAQEMDSTSEKFHFLNAHCNLLSNP